MTMHAVSTFLQNGLSLQLPLRCVGIRPRQATYAPFGRNDFPFFMMTSWLVSHDELHQQNRGDFLTCESLARERKLPREAIKVYSQGDANVSILSFVKEIVRELNEQMLNVTEKFINF